MKRFPTQRISIKIITALPQQPITVSNSKPTKKRYFLTTSKAIDQKQRSGISLERRNRISMERLYDENAFSTNKIEDSTKCNSSRTLFTKSTQIETPKYSRISRRANSFLEGSEYLQRRAPLVAEVPLNPLRLNAHQQQILNSYYQSGETMRSSSIMTPMFINPQEDKKIILKKYDISRIIQY